jgi:hypothetical protein
MEKQRKPLPHIEAQGVELIDLVIERVRADPYSIADFCGDHPLKEARPIPPEVLELLTFPSGKPLSPSLKRWLAFDTSWLAELGWFASVEQCTFTPRRLDEIARAELAELDDETGPLEFVEPGDELDDFDKPYAENFAKLNARMGECFLLLDGTESRRVLVVTDPDALGEYPVIVIDVQHYLPYAAVMYPGFDVYMADHAGMRISYWDHWEVLSDDPRYKARIQQHAEHLFGGKVGIDLCDEQWKSHLPRHSGPEG